ncbi:interaptin-like [Colias croceus]|uniref:interaptin-like n=1 Tax=Colias crocea TaxID=72248 RepID=UPI001E27D1B1|nr:interaptin-like [Colias croceus]
MKTLILLTALAAIACAGPAYLGKDGVEQESRLNGVLKTIKRERKSPIPESTSDLSSDLHSQTLPGIIEKSSNSGFRKPIIVKKKFGYHIYRDSDEELAQSEPRHNCRRQFRFKLCDDDDETSNEKMRNLHTEDIDNTDVEQSLKMAKEAVESLQRDLQKIQRNAKLTQKHHSDEQLETELNKKAEEPRHVEHLSENISSQDPLWKTMPTKSEETRMAEWKEAIENIQKNVEIAKNIEDSLRSSERSRLLSSEVLDISKARKSESVESTMVDPNLLTEEMKLENNEEKEAKIPEENMETYATESKDVKVSLTSDNLKVDKEGSDLMHHISSKMSLNEESKIPDENDLKHEKHADADLLSTQDLEEKTISKDIISTPKAAHDSVEIHQGIELPKPENLDTRKSIKSDSINEKSANLDNAEEEPLLKLSKETLEVSDETEKMKAKEVTGLKKEENINMNNLEIKDADTSESRILVKNADSLMEKEANIQDLFEKKLSDRPVHWGMQKLANTEEEKQITVDLSKLNAETPEMRSTHEINEDKKEVHKQSIVDLSKNKLTVEKSEVRSNHEDKNVVEKQTELKAMIPDDLLKERSEMREATEDDEKQLVAGKSNMENDLMKLREFEEKDVKIIPNDISQARSVESEQTEKLFDRKIHDDKIAKSVGGIDSAIKVEAPHSPKNPKIVDMTHEKQHFNNDLKFRKVSESFDNQKLEKHNRDMMHEGNTLRLIDQSVDSHGHLPTDSIIDLNAPSTKMSEIDYYTNLNSQDSAQLSQDHKTNYHTSTHIKDGMPNWNRHDYDMQEPFVMRGWPQRDRFRSDSQLDANTGALGHIHHHHHPGKIHFEDDSHHFLPMGRFVNNAQGNKHEFMINEDIQESGREAEWDAAMQPSSFMHMRDALDKNGSPFGYRHAGFGPSMPLVGPAPGGSNNVGLFPSSNGGCGIPLLLSCSPSVVSGSLAKSHSVGYNSAAAYRSGDDMRFYTKRDANSLTETPAGNVKTFSLAP